MAKLRTYRQDNQTEENRCCAYGTRIGLDPCWCQQKIGGAVGGGVGCYREQLDQGLSEVSASKKKVENRERTDAR